MSYSEILEGLEERFATVAGIKAILRYEPRSFQTFPLLYSLLDSVSIETDGGVRVYHYRILHRLVLPWQDNEKCELDLIAFVNSIPAAVDADPQLGGRLTNGWAEISDIDADWIQTGAGPGAITYRALDFYSDVTEG